MPRPIDKIGQTSRRGIKDEILRLRREGMSLRDIVDELNCAKSTVNYHLNREGLLDIGLKTQEVTEEDKKNIFEYTKTHTIKEAMKKFGFGRTTTIRYMARKNAYPTAEKKQAIVEYRKSHTTKETAKYFNVSETSVNKYRRELSK